MHPLPPGECGLGPLGASESFSYEVPTLASCPEAFRVLLLRNRKE